MAAPTLPETLPATREALHRLAEHVLAAARYAATGRIGLRPLPGGFGTPPFGPEPTVLAMDVDELVVTRAGQQRRRPVRTLAQAAEFAGTPLGAPAQVYPPATPLEPDAPLRIDSAAARLLADWFQLGAAALNTFAAEAADDKPSEAQLWPEHFDLGISAARINYGVSPGDAAMGEPYLYIGPHDGPPEESSFWNAPFGAVLRFGDVTSVERAVTFFHDGRHRAHTPQRSKP